jgi:hypothetical protein
MRYISKGTEGAPWTVCLSHYCMARRMVEQGYVSWFVELGHTRARTLK